MRDGELYHTEGHSLPLRKRTGLQCLWLLLLAQQAGRLPDDPTINVCALIVAAPDTAARRGIHDTDTLDLTSSTYGSNTYHGRTACDIALDEKRYHAVGLSKHPNVLATKWQSVFKSITLIFFSTEPGVPTTLQTLTAVLSFTDL